MSDARAARPFGSRAKDAVEDPRLTPDGQERFPAEVARPEVFRLGKGAGIDIASGCDQAGQLGRSAKLEALQRCRSERIEVKKRVAGENVGVCAQPLVQADELVLCGSHRFVNRRAATRGLEPRHAQGRVKFPRQLQDIVKLMGIGAAIDKIDRSYDGGCHEPFQRRDHLAKCARSADGVATRFGSAVQAELQVDAAQCFQLPDAPIVEK